MSINSFTAHVGSDNQNVKMSLRSPRKSEARQDEPALGERPARMNCQCTPWEGEPFRNANAINLKGQVHASCPATREALPAPGHRPLQGPEAQFPHPRGQQLHPSKLTLPLCRPSRNFLQPAPCTQVCSTETADFWRSLSQRTAVGGERRCLDE